MPIMPGAIWRPLAANWSSQPRMRAHDIFCLHTMVGSLVGTDGYFKVGNGTGYGGTESHFGVGPDGTIFQWQDTDYQADANGNGNWHVISSENADTGAPFPKWGGSDVPAFTPEQIEANARIAAWLNEVHGIPLDLIPDSKPGRRGIGVHRLGVPGYMAPGAERWSDSEGKACPGDRRIAQAPQVSDRAKNIRRGLAPAKPVLTPAQIEENEIMAVAADITKAVTQSTRVNAFIVPTSEGEFVYVPGDLYFHAGPGTVTAWRNAGAPNVTLPAEQHAALKTKYGA